MADPCKETIWEGMARYRCSRTAVEDGYCKQHHPKTIEARRQKRNEKWRLKDEARYKAESEQKVRKCASEAVLAAAVQWSKGRHAGDPDSVSLLEAVQAYRKLVEAE